MNTNFEHYGHHFQEKLAFLILEDRVFSDRIMEVLKIEFLETKYLQWFVDKIFEYKKKYKAHPSRETMEMILKSSLSKENELIQKQVKDFYSKEVMSVVDNSEYIKNEALDFCRKQKLHEAMIKAAQLLKGNSFDEIKSLIDNAMKAGAEIDTGHDYLKDFEKRYVENVRFPISTGHPKIDEITNGGIGRGEYAIIMGASGSGKSQMLVNLGAAILQGKNVLYYTLELRPEVIGQRFDACLTGFTIDDLKQHKEEVLAKIGTLPGTLKIKFYPKKSASMMTIRNHIERLKMEGFIPDVIILDYLDLLKSITIKKELRHEIGDTYDEFESLNQELNTAGLTASQINRTGASSKVVLMEHISEAFNKHFGSYLTIGLARDNNDKVKNTGRLSILKNRNGPDGNIFNIFMDAATVEIKVLDEFDPTGMSSLEENLVDEDEYKRRMREKFKKFKGAN